MTTVRILLVLALIRSWNLQQLDIKNTFLHGDLQEVIYMNPPPGYKHSSPNQVYDMIIIGNDEVGISHLKNLLHSSFKMKDLGKLTYFLSLEVSYGKEGIKLSQQKYAKDLVKLVNLTDNKKVHTLMEANTKYKKEEGEC
ncbi:hypothetical protein P3S67_002850 [Capsicum chacoense]